jgi:hypothetical protein
VPYRAFVLVVACACSPSGGDDGGAAGGGGSAASSGTGARAASGSGGEDRGAGGAGGRAGSGGAGGAGAAPSDAGARDAGAADAGADGAAPSGGDDVIVTIENGDFWLDTAGERIEAHGAGLIYADGAWYWIGEDKSANSGGFKAVNCYRSTDLSHWEFENAIITRQTSSDLAAADRIIERPKVIYNEATKKYVMWLHWEGMNYGTAEAGVFTSDSVDGDYTQVRHMRPNGNMSRDDTLFRDDDGKAYFLSAANENADSALYELTDDYTDIARQIATLWPGSYREAPAIMKANGVYFIVGSGATNWDPNQQKYATAPSMDGPWSALSNVGDATGYDTQTAFIIPFKGSKTTTYIYAGDRWQDPDLGSSKYIWLPIKVNGQKLVIDYYDSWQLNVTTGEWSAGDAAGGFLPQTDWTLVSADSEETAGEDGHAANAFDGTASTFWHTQWQGAQPPLPHEIVIDLGARYALTGMRYTPRGDGNQNGMVKDYALYVSDSKSDFGSAVKTGSFGSGTAPTTVELPAAAGRYVRFRALSSINGTPYTSVAEIDLAGTPM